MLLNALIAITGETFGAIWEAKLAQGYREKVLQMYSLQISFAWLFKDNLNPNHRLFVAQKMISKEGNSSSSDRQSAQQEIRTLSAKVASLKEDIT